MSDNGSSKKLLVYAVVAVLVAVGAWFAFGKLRPTGKSTDPGPSAQLPTQDGGDQATTPDPAAALTMEDYNPAILLAGEEGALPEAIRIVFGRPITANVGGAVPAATALKVEPAVSGKLRYENDRTLLFTPDKPLAYGTSYTATIEALGLEGGQTVKATGGVARVFQTPNFTFKRAQLSRYDASGRIEVDVVFTGPVDAKKLYAHARWAAKSPIDKVDYRTGKAVNQITASLPAAAVKDADKIVLTLRAGMPSAVGGAVAQGDKTVEVPLFDGKDVEIKSVRLKEGINGFYVQVLCNDKARTGDGGDNENNYRNRIYYYDYETHDGMYLSDRCVLDEKSAAGRITFTPPVQVSLVPSRGGFRILGDFPSGELAMTIDSGIESVDGAVLKVPFTQTFNVPHRKPSVGFVANGRYLPRSAWKNLGIRHLNVAEAELSVRVVPQENLVFWMSADQETADERNSNLVVKRSLNLKGEADKQGTTYIDLSTTLNQPPKGVLELTVTELPSRQAVQKKRLLVTDINLVAKRAKNGKSVQVWALGMHDAKPLGGVVVKQIVKSGRALSECVTDSSGGCKLDYDAEKEVDPSPPFALIATKDGDLTYLKYADLKTEISEQLVQGRPFTGGETPYRAAVYSDRGAYRPGETAHVAAIVRGADDLAPKDGLPVELNLFDPREKLVRKLPLTSNGAGVVTADLSFPSFANTGRYRVALMAGKAEIGRYTFNVEEFVPERMKVDAEGAQPALLNTEPALVDVSARYLFGGSAEGSRVELGCELWPAAFTPKDNANFEYGVWYPDQDKPKALPLGAVNGQLDAEGKTQLACPTPEQGGGFAGPAQMQARVAVFEGESGRSSQNTAVIPVHPERFYIGLSSGSKKVLKGDTLAYSGVVVDWDGKVKEEMSDTVEIELVRLESEYDWSWDEGSGESGYRRYLRQASEGKSAVTVKNGRFSGEFKIATNGSGFLVRARMKKAQTDLRLDGEDRDYWWYPSETSRDQTPRPFKPGWVDVTTADKISTGETVKVSFTAPFKGRALVTAETDEIIASEWRDVSAGPVEWAFKVDQFYPNVYVSVFMVKDPHLESKESFMPDRAFGVKSVRLEPKDFQHELKLSTPGEVKPNSTLTVDVDLGKAASDDAYVTLAAVDEGILSLTRFKTPDPIRTIFEPRALGIETFETIGWNVMLPGAGNASPTGGGEGADDKPVTLVKPVALWSGLVKVKDGKASVSFEIPQYRGELRVMAVSIDKQRIGSAAANVFVRDPLVLQTTLPRFMTDGDQVQIPVSVTNMSGKPQNVKIELGVKSIQIGDDQVDDAVMIQGDKAVTIPLAVSQSQTVVFRAMATAMVGGAEFNVKATSEDGSLESHEDLQVPIIPNLPKSRVLKRLEIAKGETDVTAELAGWTPMTERSTFWVTSNPYGDAMGHLKHLIRYPYGCIEQTTSSTRPLLVIRDLIQEIDPNLAANGGALIEDMVKKGVDRVLSMQTPAGGFGYWPGDDHPTAWATAYATHMLLDAQKLQFPVPKERVDDAVEWLHGQLVNTFRHVSDSDNGYYDLRHAAPYMHYVLALAGRGLKADMEKLLERLNPKATGNGEIAEQIYLLKAGIFLTGDRRYEGELKLPDVSPITSDRNNSWSYWSDLRRRGMMLSVMTDLFGADPAGDKLASIVADRLRAYGSGWYTTQELVWSITGLGKYVAGGSKSFKAKLTADGKQVANQGGDKGYSWILPRASEKKKVVLDLDKADDGKVYLILSSEGIKTNPEFKTGGEGLALQRTYRKADGSPLDPQADISLGEVIYTEITIENKTSELIENIALVDRFPAGWEIENPRLGRGGGAQFIDTNLAWNLAYMNIRDDRMEVFGSLRARESKKVYYASRAVVSGRFSIPSVEAEAMYDPRIWAREAGGKTNIKGPWKEFANQ